MRAISILALVLVGLIAGILARVAMPGSEPGGLILNIVIGIVGALVGAVGAVIGCFIVANLGGPDMNDFNNLPSILVATLGAIILLVMYRPITRRSAQECRRFARG